MFCPNTGTKFREPYHLDHLIPRLADGAWRMQLWKMDGWLKIQHPF